MTKALNEDFFEQPKQVLRATMSLNVSDAP